MALPPGTFGWLGSGFDCTCGCSFVGGFAYNDSGLLGSVCLLQFAVGNLQSGCTVINVEDADITIALEVNGTPITDSLIYDTTNNVIYWDKWKPTAGDVYTADVTLDCGTETFTKSYTYTIPTPSNTSCVCCTEQVPDYLVVTGGAGCCNMANGTWALSLGGGTCAAGTRNYTYSDPDVFGAPSVPCSGACFSAFDSGTGRTYYFYRRGITFTVTMPPTAGPDNITITITITYRVYYDNGGGCTSFTSAAGVTHSYTLTCSGGNAGTGSGGSITLAFGFSTTPCASAPTVELFFA